MIKHEPLGTKVKVYIIFSHIVGYRWIVYRGEIEGYDDRGACVRYADDYDIKMAWIPLENVYTDRDDPELKAIEAGWEESWKKRMP